MSRAIRFNSVAMMTCVSWLVALAPLSGSEPESPTRIERVEMDRLVEAMRAETGYDNTKTTQAGRFQGGVYLRLARSIPESDRPRTVLFIDHADWHQAYLTMADVGEDQAPVFVRLQYENRQDVFIDARRGQVVQEAQQGPAPLLALNVRLSWPNDAGVSDSYSFEDLMAEPHVLVHNDRVVTFRLLDLGDQMVFDQVRGSRVRPLTGAMATLFRVIGLASVKRVRMVVGNDGMTVVRANVKKLLFKVSATVIVQPDGRAARDVPQDRSDLLAMERRLKKPLDLEYEPTDWEALVTAAYAQFSERVRTP